MLKLTDWNVKRNIRIIFGAVICTIITVMYLTKSFNLEHFYDVGNVYIVSKAGIMSSGSNWIYDYNTRSVSITDEAAAWSYNIQGSQKNWKFLYLEMEGLTSESDWNIYFRDENWEPLQFVNQKIQNGWNIIPIETEEFSIISFEILNQKDLNFTLKEMQFREELRPFEWQEFGIAFGVIFALYLCVWFFTYQWKKKRGKRKNIPVLQMEKLQKLYSSVLEKGEKVCRTLTVSAKSKIRIICFLLCYINIYLLVIKRWRWNILTQRKLVFLLGLYLIAIAFVSWEKKKEIISWKSPLAYGWLMLWGMCVISDFVVLKSFRGVGVFMLLAVGTFYLAWNQMERPQDLLLDLKRAMRWFYWMGCIFCIICRPADMGYRYMGIFDNPNTFAGYLATLNIVFLDDMNEILQKKNVKYREFLKSAAGLVSVCYLLQWTQSVTAVTAYAFEWILFFWRQFLNRKKERYGKNVIKSLSAIAISSFLVFTVGKWCLLNGAGIFGTVINIPGDYYEIRNQSSPVSMIVQAASSQGPDVFGRISQKLFSDDISLSLSGRDTIWINYIQHLNLFGHKHWLECSGQVIHAHNNLLQMMYDYGVFVLLPYVIMFYYTIKNSMKNLWKDSEMSLFVAGAVLNFHIIGMAEDVTTPYSFASWLTYYIVIGSLFCIKDKGETIRR